MPLVQSPKIRNCLKDSKFSTGNIRDIVKVQCTWWHFYFSLQHSNPNDEGQKNLERFGNIEDEVFFVVPFRKGKL